MGGFWGFFGALAGAIVGAIVAIPLAPAAIVGGVVGLGLCLTGIICPSTNTNNPGGVGAPGSGVTITQPGNTRGPGNSGSGGSGAGGGRSPTACSTQGANACGMRGQGFLNANGVCSATIPPNSACPTPVINTGTGFYADPNLVKSGNQTNLRWNVTNATACAISGGGLSLPALGITGVTQSPQITQKTIFTLNCINGVGGPSASANATVNLVPSFQEI